ncbi:MAG: TolB family protein [Acidobacteriota bacterium]
MKKICYSFLVIILLSSFISAQKLSVVETVKLTDKSQGEFYFPRNSPDGSKIFFTSASYKGIWYFDVQSNKIIPFTSEDGAGYEYVFSNDSKSVIYRANNPDERGFRRNQSLVKRNMEDLQSQVIVTAKELSTPKSLASNNIAYMSGGNVILKADGSRLKKTGGSDLAVYNVDGKIILYMNGTKKEFSPFPGGQYIWPSLSPDGTRILFTEVRKGAFVADLDGNILSSLGNISTPNWSPDGKWITYMVEKDNGEFITGSEIFVSSSDGKTKYQLTDTSDLIEMYPVWASDGMSILFNSVDGSIYSLKLKME